MGIGSLRRYHKPLTNTGASTDAPVVASGPTETPEEAEAARLANEAELAQEQQAQATAANADPTGAQSVNPIVQEAGGVEDNAANTGTTPPATIPTEAPGVESQEGAEHEEVTTGTPVTPGTAEGAQEQQEAAGDTAEGEAAAVEASTKHGDLDQPNRGSSKQLWLDYTAADPGGAPEGHEGLSRDQLAELYLGPRE